MGARGNSGVISSQILAGLARECPADLDGAAIAGAFARARDAAYGVVSKPREGTILTAISAAADAAQLSAADGGAAIDVLAVAAAAAQEATDRTPEMLPVSEGGWRRRCRRARAVRVMLDGMVRAIRGESGPAAADLGAIDASWLSATQRAHADGQTEGFCTEFVVRGEGLALDTIRGELSQHGDSLLVVGDQSVVRVHVHTGDPDAAFSYARSLGTVTNEKVENMEAQFRDLAAARDEAAPDVDLAVVVVAAGDGLEELFRSLGATAVVHGGQTMNPSAGDIRDAIASAAGRETIVLPNNKNIVLAADQAAGVVGASVRVLPTRSIPQGIAALVALNTEVSLDENLEAMAEAVSAVRSGEVTLAARDTTIGGVAVREGQPIGLVDGELIAAEENVPDAVRSLRRAHGRWARSCDDHAHRWRRGDA